MSPRIKEAKPDKNHTFDIIFTDGSKGKFDLKPFLDKGRFKELTDYNNFINFYLDDGVITWYNGLDISPDTVYLLKDSYFN